MKTLRLLYAGTMNSFMWSQRKRSFKSIKNHPWNHSNAKDLKESNDALDTNLTAFLNSLGGNTTQNAQVQCRKSYNPTTQPWRARENTGHQYPPQLLILSLRGIKLFFLPQVHREIGRDRQTPKVLAGCKRPEGRGAKKPAKWDRGRSRKPQLKLRYQLAAAPRTKIRACILWPWTTCSVWTNLLVYYAVHNKLEGLTKKKKNICPNC